jgi:tRNA nucleotidyltransferase (CCA-adding enzyme)
MKIPKTVREVMYILEWGGFQAYIVGGAVRDRLAGFPVFDWDICTDATPHQVYVALNTVASSETNLEYSGQHVIDMQEEFGATKIGDFDGNCIDVTTFREDYGYDGHHKSKVKFINDLKTDLMRRDFTINAIACDVRGVLYDPLNGIKDLNQRTLRFIGDPRERIEQDPLRILRGIRLITKLGLGTADIATLTAFSHKAHLLDNLSGDIMREEIVKAFADNAGKFLQKLRLYGVLPYVFPAVHETIYCPMDNPFHRYRNVYSHIQEALNHCIKQDLAVQLAVLYHDTGKLDTYRQTGSDVHFYGHEKFSVQHAEEELSRYFLPYSNILDRVYALIKYHHVPITTERKRIKKVMNLPVEFSSLMMVKLADDEAKNTEHEQVKERIESVPVILKTREDIYRNKEAFSLRQLAVNGHDMLALGLEGPDVGKVLQYLLDRVMEHPSMNTHERCMALASQWKEELCQN